MRIAGIAKAEHAVAQIRQLGSAWAEQVLDEGAAIIRRIAIALRTDHQVQQALALELAKRVDAGIEQAHRDARGLQLGAQLFGRAPGIAGLAGIDHADRLRGNSGYRHRSGVAAGVRCALRQAGAVAGNPPQGRAVEAIHQARQQDVPVLGKRASGLAGDLRRHRGVHSFGRPNGRDEGKLGGSAR